MCSYLYNRSTVVFSKKNWGGLIRACALIRLNTASANSVESDQMLRPVDLGLHCLPRSLLWDNRH